MWIQKPTAAYTAHDAALAEAAAAMARLDEALQAHPLRQAFLYRARMEAARHQAAVDGQLIEPWHLAALLEGLRLRMDGALRIIDRGSVLEAARRAFTVHQWLADPDFDQEGEIRRAEKHLTGFTGPGHAPLLAAAKGLHAWLDGGGSRGPARAALVRFWTGQRTLRQPVPLTGSAALRADAPWARSAWIVVFLRALAAEAADARQLLLDLERAWFAARAAVAGRRRDSHCTAAVDLLAATPLLSATTLAGGLELSIKSATRLLDSLVTAGVAVEVTHRSRRRLFGLRGMAPLAEVVRPPYRPEPGRGRGRPPVIVERAKETTVMSPPPGPIDRRRIEYAELEQAMAFLEERTRQTRRALGSLVGDGGSLPSGGGESDANHLRDRA